MKKRPLIVASALAIVIAVTCWLFSSSEKELPADYETLLDQVWEQDKDCTMADAIAQGNIRMLLNLLHVQKTSGKADALGNTPLHLAALADRADMVYILLNAGFDPLAENADKKRPFELAPSIPTRNACLYGEARRKSELALFNTIAKGRSTDKEAALQKALSQGINPDARNGGSQLSPTLLAESVRFGTPDMVRALIKAGANIHAPLQRKATLLHLAATAGRPDMVPVLIAAGCSPFEQMDNGSTPLHNAIYNGKTAAAKVLIPHYRAAGFNPSGSKLASPIVMAINRGNPEVVKAMLAAGLDPNSKAFAAEPLLILAVRSKRLVIAQALIAAGADKGATDKNGKRARDYATGPFVKLLD